MNSKTDLRSASDPNRDRKAAASTALRPLPHRRGFVRSAFTLVELLVVIAVIGLLISILVPAVNQVRLRAKETTTEGTLGTLATAIETYKADGRVGGGYPPSRSDADGTSGLDHGQVAGPYTDMTNQPSRLYISGAGLLVWALVGADFQGCPGFRTFDPGHAHWSDDTHANPTTDPPGAYALDSNDQPFHARSGRFVDVDKISISRANAARGRFEIEAEVEARHDMGLAYADRLYPMFLDSFGFPILYWRADPAGVKLADLDGSPTGIQRGVYHWLDNGPLLADTPLSNQEEPLFLRPGATEDDHLLGWEDFSDGPGYEPEANWPRGCFQYFIRNEQSQAKDVPHNPDTHLLISPGADGLYGTADDITNFPHNGVDQQ